MGEQTVKMNRPYSLALSLPGKILALVHYAFTTAFLLYIVLTVYAEMNGISHYLGLVIALIIFFSSGIAYYWWKLLIGPISLYVTVDGKLCLINLFRQKTQLPLSDIVFIDVHFVLVRVKTTQSEFIFSNGFRNLNEFIEDIRRDNQGLIVKGI
jgi:hypothetical protein